MATQELLTAALNMPDNVVYSAFAEETVVLNLDTGMYHGLNQTAATMLEMAASTPTIGAAVQPLADAFDVDADTIQRDLLALCGQLHERGLIEITDGEQP